MRLLWSFRYLLLIVSITVGFALLERSWVYEGTSPRATYTERDDVRHQISDTYAQLYPNRPKSNYFRAAIAVEEQRYDQALEYFQRAVELQGNDERLLYEYAGNLVEVGAGGTELDDALQQWRYHYPHSRRPVPHTLQSREESIEQRREPLRPR